MTDPRARSIDEQLKYEYEGALAAVAGKTEDDCPYSKADHSFEWNHWLAGCWEAQGELAAVTFGVVTFSDEDGNIVETLTTRQAIETGRWRPRFLLLRLLDQIERMKGQQ